MPRATARFHPEDAWAPTWLLAVPTLIGMQTKIRKWGNSLGLRFPTSFAAKAQMEAGSTVDLTVENGSLVVRPLRTRLSELLKRVNLKFPRLATEFLC